MRWDIPVIFPFQANKTLHPRSHAVTPFAEGSAKTAIEYLALPRY